jgi:hypothetical protein
MCRLFGYRFAHPELRSQPFCPKVPLLRPGDTEARLFRAYEAFCEEAGFIIVGVPRDPADAGRYAAENRRALAEFPELDVFRGFLAGISRR